MAANGRLPASMLAPVAGGRLRKDAALAWNALNVRSRARHGVTLMPLGGMSTYRTYAQQVWLWNNVPHRHDTNWVAVPGTSNHGWGLAVDLASMGMRRILDELGAPFGWAKRWSDAPLEFWHIRYRPGVWVVRGAGPPTLRKGTRHRGYVRKVQRMLRGLHLYAGKVDGAYGLGTRRAIRRFQKAHGLPVDGVVGARTWAALERRSGGR